MRLAWLQVPDRVSVGERVDEERPFERAGANPVDPHAAIPRLADRRGTSPEHLQRLAGRELTKPAEKRVRALVARVRSGRGEHHPRDACRELRRHGAAVGAGPQMMRLVDDQHVERHGVDRGAHLGTLDQIDRRDDELRGAPRIHADRQVGDQPRERGVIDDQRREPETILELRRPLLAQRRGCEDERARREVPRAKLREDQASLDRLAEPDFVRQQRRASRPRSRPRAGSSCQAWRSIAAVAAVQRSVHRCARAAARATVASTVRRDRRTRPVASAGTRSSSKGVRNVAVSPRFSSPAPRSVTSAQSSNDSCRTTSQASPLTWTR